MKRLYRTLSSVLVRLLRTVAFLTFSIRGACSCHPKKNSKAAMVGIRQAAALNCVLYSWSHSSSLRIQCKIYGEFHTHTKIFRFYIYISLLSKRQSKFWEGWLIQSLHCLIPCDNKLGTLWGNGVQCTWWAIQVSWKLQQFSQSQQRE